MTQSNQSQAFVRVSLSVAGKAKEGEKPFYTNVGSGIVRNGRDVIAMNIFPGVSVSGGLVKVEKDKLLPSDIATAPRLLVKVAETFLANKGTPNEEEKRKFHTVGSAFPVSGKEGMFSLALPEGLSLNTGFLLCVPRSNEQ